MPLKDRDRMRPRRLIRLGIIRLGHKAQKTLQNGKVVEYPVQDDHFVLTDAPELADVYGPEPTELDVILPFPDVPRNFDASYEVWAGGILVCKGDGEQVLYAAPFRVVEKGGKVRVYNADGDTWVNNGQAQVALEWDGQVFRPGDTVPCPGATRDLYPHCQACRLSAILKVMMADPRLFRLGYYQVATGSGRNYDSILGTLELVSANGQRPVYGIPFKLRLVKETTMYVDDGKRRPTERWFLQLEPDPDVTRRLYQRQVNALIGAGEPAALLPEPGEYDAEPQAPPPFAESGGPAIPPEEAEREQVEPSTAEPRQGNSVKRSDALKAWHTLRSKAQLLGLQVGALPPDVTVEQIVEAGKALRDEVIAKWTELCGQADASDIPHGELEDGASGVAIAEAALALKAQITKARADREQAGEQVENRSWPSLTIQAVIEAGLAENSYAAVGMLKHSHLSPADEMDLCLEWASVYRESRNAGGTVEDAAASANAWLDGIMGETREE